VRKFVLKKQHDSRGMSLVELMLVMAILSVVMLAVMSLYVPAYQSTVAQTQVSDVQSNLRLALKTMTRDLLLAGFLVPTNPVIFEASATPTTAENIDPNDFTIRTRIVGSDFARVLTDATSLSTVKVANADMADNFPDNSLVRLFEPISANEINLDTVSDPDKRVYLVLNTVKDLVNDTATFQISDPNTTLAAGDITAETVIVRVRDNAQPPVQTIRYRLNNGVLERIVNGSLQILARNVDAAGSGFTYERTSQVRVKWVGIKLTGETKALKNDAVSGEKVRSVETSVKLRNIN
jgi:prepilin-type N-terminal cleavage/methylation domain-containing protein